MVDPSVIEIVIQGGALGILLAFGAGFYLIVRRVIEVLRELAENHVAHLTRAVGKNSDVLDRLSDAVEGCPARDAGRREVVR